MLERKKKKALKCGKNSVVNPIKKRSQIYFAYFRLSLNIVKLHIKQIKFEIVLVGAIYQEYQLYRNIETSTTYSLSFHFDYYYA